MFSPEGENHMILLGIDTATERLSAALFIDGATRERYTDSRSSHCELLTGFIGELVAEADIGMEDIGGVAVSIGPGSFTGLRIGIATAMGAAYSIGVKTAGVNTLAALAWNAAEEGSLVCPLIDAKRSEAYTAVYRLRYGDVPETVLAPCTIPVDRLNTIICAFGEPLVITGPAAENFGERLEEANADMRFVPPEKARPSAAAVAGLGEIVFARGGAVEPSALEPVYLRRSDAEIARDNRKCGR